MKARDTVLTSFLLLFLCIFLSTSPAFGYSMGATYNWDASVPNYNAAATIHNGTIDTSTLAIGDFLGINSSTPNADSFGSSGVAVGWDDTWTGSVGNANTNGDALDGLWAQIYSSGGWWDLGAQYSTAAVFTSQDHGPYLAEGLEYRVYGTNTLWNDATLSPQASITDVYLDGWRPHNPAEDGNGNGWLSDDITGVFNLGGSYQYIKLVAWTSTGSLNEPEVDAVAGVASVPEPTTILLLGAGLVGLAGFGRKKFKKM